MSKKKKNKKPQQNRKAPEKDTRKVSDEESKKGSTRKSASQASPAKSTFTKWRFGRRYEYTPDGRTILHKRTYVLEDKLKKFIIGSVIIVLATIILGNIAVIASNQLKNDAIEKELQDSMAQHSSQTVSLNGITAQQRDFLDSTGKFNGFAEVGGLDSSKVYNSDIRPDEAIILEGKEQIDGSGIVDPKKPDEEESNTEDPSK